jgi:hypothetical protein
MTLYWILNYAQLLITELHSYLFVVVASIARQKDLQERKCHEFILNFAFDN